MISQRYLILSLLEEPPLPFPLPSSPKTPPPFSGQLTHGDFSPPKGRKEAFLFSTYFFITFQNRFLMISDPCFVQNQEKNAPKAEKVDFSRSYVLPA